MSPRILIAESTGFSRTARATLERAGDCCRGGSRSGELACSLENVDVLWVRLRHRIDVEVLAAARQLRILASPTTGLDHIDLVEASRRGVDVISLRDAGEFLKDVRATAELTIGLTATRMVSSGSWSPQTRRPGTPSARRSAG